MDAYKDNLYEEIEEEDTLSNRYLIFAIDSDSFAIQIKNVTEIVGIQHITYVPDLPEYIKGIINLRGQIIPVMDMRLRFKKPTIEYNDRTCIIIIVINDVSVGLIVDSVSEVLTIKDDDIIPPPDLGDGGDKYITGIAKVGSEVKLLLDIQKILEKENIDNLL